MADYTTTTWAGYTLYQCNYGAFTTFDLQKMLDHLVDQHSIDPNIPGRQEIWIAARTDGKDGDGSFLDPRDGSTQAKLDALIGYEPYTGVTPEYTDDDLIFHLLPGTYTTRRIEPHNGWHLIGSGIDKTIIQSDTSFDYEGLGESYENEEVHVISSFYSSDCDTSDNMIVSDMTIDCGGSSHHANTDHVMGVCLRGRNNNAIEKVKVIDPWLNEDVEHFILFIMAGPAATDCASNAIKNCIVDEVNYGGDRNYLTAIGFGGKLDALHQLNGLIEGNSIYHDGYGNGITPWMVKQLTVRNNYVNEAQWCFNVDTGTCYNTKIHDNYFEASSSDFSFCIAVGNGTGSASHHFYGTQIDNNMLIHNYSTGCPIMMVGYTDDTRIKDNYMQSNNAAVTTAVQVNDANSQSNEDVKYDNNTLAGNLTMYADTKEHFSLLTQTEGSTMLGGLRFFVRDEIITLTNAQSTTTGITIPAASSGYPDAVLLSAQICLNTEVSGTGGIAGVGLGYSGAITALGEVAALTQNTKNNWINPNWDTGEAGEEIFLYATNGAGSQTTETFDGSPDKVRVRLVWVRSHQLPSVPT